MKKKQAAVKKVVKKARAQKKVQAPRAQKSVGASPVIQFSGTYIEAVGRRKVATARVRLFEGQEGFVVNDSMGDQYFSTVPHSTVLINRPFTLTDTKGSFGISVKVNGSGSRGQLEAVVHGIARALVKFNPELRPILKREGYLTRDSRMKETRKIGMGGKARRKRQSPKR